jgi:rhodanese-related sulfurtransferase
VRALDQNEAEVQIEAGAVWIDARFPDEFIRGALNGAINIPLAFLRLRVDQLERGVRYIVYSHDRGVSAAASYLLAVRGFDTFYLNRVMIPEPAGLPAEQSTGDIAEHGADDAPEPFVPAEPDVAPALEPALYAETMNGKELAALVEDIHRHNNDLRAVDAELGAADMAEIDRIVRIEPSVLAFNLKTIFDADPVAPESETPIHDDLSRLVRLLEVRLREQMARYRDEERARIQQALDLKLDDGRRELEAKLKADVTALVYEIYARQADQTKELVMRSSKLVELANRITHQKGEIIRARRRLDEKLAAAEALHAEVRELGDNVSRQLSELADFLPEAASAQY